MQRVTISKRTFLTKLDDDNYGVIQDTQDRSVAMRRMNKKFFKDKDKKHLDKLPLSSALWFKDPEYEITLFHGTSSYYADVIKREGLYPPTEKMDEYVTDILESYHVLRKLTDAEIEYITKHLMTTRKDTQDYKLSSVIYLATSFQAAAKYAKSYNIHGGEIAYDVYNGLKVVFDERGEKPPLPRFRDAKPIVVEIELPIERALTYQPLRERLKKEKEFYEGLAQWYVDNKDIHSFEEYIEHEDVGMEVRVKEPIEPEYITKIHEV